MFSLTPVISVIFSMIANDCRVVGLYRYAVKGLSADELSEVTLTNAGDTFPDDRRFALLQEKKEGKFDATSPEWIHKENFLCAFTAPKLMASFLSSYQILGGGGSHGKPSDNVEISSTVKRLLTIEDRGSGDHLLGPVDLATEKGCDELARFCSRRSGTNVVCVTANDVKHTHQFGNTGSGVKARGDTRTVHLINAETVKELSSKIGIPLNPTQFRPNIVVEGLEPWQEFDWVGKTIQIGSTKLSVIQRTVRCEGVNIDPLSPGVEVDIPKILSKEFPEYGPFLGVYAVIDEPGTIGVGNLAAIDG